MRLSGVRHHKRLQRPCRRCGGNSVIWMHMRMLRRLRGANLRQLHSTLHRLPNLRSDSVHELCKLQWTRCFRCRNPLNWLHMHLLERVRWVDVRPVRDVILWLPNLHANSVHNRDGLQQPRKHCFRHLRERLLVHMLDRLHWGHMQLMRLFVLWVSNLCCDSLHKHRKLQWARCFR